MAKIKLSPDSTFTADVAIPMPGTAAVPVKFTFKHRSRDATLEWLNALDGKEDAAVVQEMATAWELDDSFDADNITRLLQNYGGSSKAIFDTYLRELSGARAKN